MQQFPTAMVVTPSAVYEGHSDCLKYLPILKQFFAVVLIVLSICIEKYGAKCISSVSISVWQEFIASDL